MSFLDLWHHLNSMPHLSLLDIFASENLLFAQHICVNESLQSAGGMILRCGLWENICDRRELPKRNHSVGEGMGLGPVGADCGHNDTSKQGVSKSGFWPQSDHGLISLFCNMISFLSFLICKMGESMTQMNPKFIPGKCITYMSEPSGNFYRPTLPT